MAEPGPVITTMGKPLIIGPEPVNATCPSCHESITTDIERKANTRTHLIALVLCLCGCWPCCLIPYCMNTCRSTNHTCPKCQGFLGTYTN